jgi:engulfment and cell motility protein 1
MDTLSITDLVARLGGEEDSVRKMAVFKLQSLLGDPSFADVFIAEGGLPKLTDLALRAVGNTLAYSLTSFSRLLELDKGWEFVTEELIERVRAVMFYVLTSCANNHVHLGRTISRYPTAR